MRGPGLPVSAGRRPARQHSRGLRQCQFIVLVLTLIFGVCLFYVYIFTGLQRVAHPNEDASLRALSPLEAPRVLNEAAHAVAERFSRKCPTCACDGKGAADGGDGDSDGGGGGGGSAMAGSDDPDAWLDSVGDTPPKVAPSHYALVNGMEPYERPNQKPWELHVIPTDDWYERAKKATDRAYHIARARATPFQPLGLLTHPSSSDAPPAFFAGCDLELTQKTTGAENGLSDEVVWVSALFDLKRGEAGNGEFHRPMEEYYRRFQIVLDRGFKMVIFIPQVRVAPTALRAAPEPRARVRAHTPLAIFTPAPHPRRRRRRRRRSLARTHAAL
jgi:hypothetical protein